MYPDAPCMEYLYTYIYHKFKAIVGKYSSPMEHLYFPTQYHLATQWPQVRESQESLNSREKFTINSKSSYILPSIQQTWKLYPCDADIKLLKSKERNKYMYHVYVIFGIKHTHTQKEERREKSTPSKHHPFHSSPLKNPSAKHLSAWPWGVSPGCDENHRINHAEEWWWRPKDHCLDDDASWTHWDRGSVPADMGFPLKKTNRIYIYIFT